MLVQSAGIRRQESQHTGLCLSYSETKPAKGPRCPHRPSRRPQTTRSAKCFHPAQTCLSLFRKSSRSASPLQPPARKEHVEGWPQQSSSPKDREAPSSRNSDRVSTRFGPRSQSCLWHIGSSFQARSLQPLPVSSGNRDSRKKTCQTARHSESAGKSSPTNHK